MILKISLRAKAGVPKTFVKQKLQLHSLYFPQNMLMLTESHGEFSVLHFARLAIDPQVPKLKIRGVCDSLCI